MVYKSLGEGSHVLRVGQVVPLTIIEAKQPLDTHTLFGQVVGSKYVVQVYFTDIYDGTLIRLPDCKLWLLSNSYFQIP